MENFIPVYILFIVMTVEAECHLILKSEVTPLTNRSYCCCNSDFVIPDIVYSQVQVKRHLNIQCTVETCVIF